MNKRVKIGHIIPFWNDEFKKFNYVKQSLLDEEIKRWKDEGYDKKFIKSLSGSMFDNKNPLPEWVKKFDDKFKLKNQTYNFYKMETFEIMPPHVDHYNTYVKLFNADRSQINRVIVMLEDWKSGHYFELDGKSYTNWRAGDWFMWNNNIPHAAANIGNKPRYTLQITGEVDTAISEALDKSHNRSLYYFNQTNLPESRNSDEETFIKFLYQKANLDEPFFIFLGCGPITDLIDFKHEQPPERVHIFLWEPLSTYIKNKGHSNGTYSEYSFNTKHSCIGADELDSIELYCKNNNLKKNQVIVHTCHYKVEKYFSHYKNLNLITDDLFLKTYNRFINTQFFPKTYFKTTFLCHTWRYTKHRHLITSFLSTYSNSDYNWFYKCDFEILSDNLFFDFQDLKLKDELIYYYITTGVDKLNEQSPVSLDIQVDAPTIISKEKKNYFPNIEYYSGSRNPAFENPSSLKFESLYDHIFCVIICETRFAEHCGNFSEKVYQAVQMKRPFIIVAPPLTLEYFRSLGFQSFGEFWDESYDTETDHLTRLIKICRLIISISKLTHDEKINLNNKMFKVLYHNFKLLFNLTQKELHLPNFLNE